MLQKASPLGALRSVKTPRHTRHFIGAVLRRILPRPTVVKLKAYEKKPRIIFSGIQPTGVPHLGNYLGAVREWVKLQNENREDTKLFFSLVDLHAITIRQPPERLRQWQKESLAMLLAIGLDPMKCTIFYQSHVPAHAELMWYLSCQASTGYLSRMTQWKEKTAGDKANVERQKLGLFSYPVLQAADILLYQTTHVPVGHDQAQHLEFTRELANGFNSAYEQQVFRVPETIISPARRVMSLTDPKSKMSKSHPNDKTRILLTDSAETVNAKLKAAVTDSLDGISYDPEKRPGVSNLIDMLYHIQFEGSDITKEDLAQSFEGASLKALKETVADAVNHTLEPIRWKYNKAVNDEGLLTSTALQGMFDAVSCAHPTITAVREAMGLQRTRVMPVPSR